jgi:low temperature requirement protein LtrA
MVAGIIAVAAADQLTVARPTGHATLPSVGLTLGGTALFLAGQALFKRAVFGGSHVVAIAALIALVPASFMMPALALSGAAGLIVVGVAV